MKEVGVTAGKCHLCTPSLICESKVKQCIACYCKIKKNTEVSLIHIGDNRQLLVFAGNGGNEARLPGFWAPRAAGRKNRETFLQAGILWLENYLVFATELDNERRDQT